MKFNLKPELYSSFVANMNQRNTVALEVIDDWTARLKANGSQAIYSFINPYQVLTAAAEAEVCSTILNKLKELDEEGVSNEDALNQIGEMILDEVLYEYNHAKDSMPGIVRAYVTDVWKKMARIYMS